MKLLDFLALVLYAFALSVIVFLLFRIFFPPVITVERPVVVSWWPWSSPYNNWPSWYGGYGGSGGYRGRMRRHHAEEGHWEHARPWGGGSRMSNTGGFHSDTPAPVPAAPPAPAAPSAPPAPSAPSAPPAPSK